MPRVRLIFLLLCLGVVGTLILLNTRSHKSQACIEDLCVDLEVVSKKSDMMRGLQGRTSLAGDKGMLFVFPKEDLHRFWMKDMVIAIDIIWLDRFGKIVSIGEKLPPCVTEPCAIYAPANIARYVLEANAGFSTRHGLKVGDTFRFKGI